MQGIRKDGSLDYLPLIIDSALERGMGKLVTEISSKKLTDNKKCYTLNKSNNRDYFLAITPSTFINRSLFYAFMLQYSNWLRRNNERRLVLLDNLASHVFNTTHRNEWRIENPSSYCYVDKHTFENIVMVFLPPLSTSVAQPADLGLYCLIQGSFKRWFNKQDDKKQISRKTKIEQVKKLY